MYRIPPAYVTTVATVIRVNPGLKGSNDIAQQPARVKKIGAAVWAIYLIEQGVSWLSCVLIFSMFAGSYDIGVSWRMWS